MDTQEKKVYEPPQLMDFGRLTDLTSQTGTTNLTDCQFTGSNEPSGLADDCPE